MGAIQSVPPPTREFKSNNGDKYFIQREDNADLVGADIKAFNDVPSPIDCGNNCNTDDNCVGFSFNPSNSHCVLKSADVLNAPVDPNNGYIFYERKKKVVVGDNECVMDKYDESIEYPGEGDNQTRWCRLGVKNCKDKFCSKFAQDCKKECAQGVTTEVVSEKKARGSGFDMDTSTYLCYGNMHEDLKQNICDNGMCHTKTHMKSLMKHWKEHGMGEGRTLCTPEITKKLSGGGGNITTEMYRIGYNPKTIRGMQI